jgi:N-acetylmuramoyl-L-alanine amidase
MQRLALILFIFLFGNLAHANILLKKVNSRFNSRATRINFYFNRPALATIFTLSSPHRVVFDFKNTRTRISLASIKQHNPLIKNVRVSNKKNRTLRIVLDTTLTVTPQVVRSKVHSIIQVNLIHKPLKVVKQHKTLKKKIIVIDPGHGGKDPGAIGPRGIKEKNITLAISKELAHEINRHPTLHAVLTRNKDRYISLQGRLRLARIAHADLFIAVHADATQGKSARGVSVFALSKRQGTSDATRWLASHKRVSHLLSGAKLKNKSYLLRRVLLDLSLTSTVNSSFALGKLILHRLSRVSKKHTSFVKKARFMVLKSPDIPSILIETGFLSNRVEARRLNQPHYQRLLARTIFNGIQRYLRLQPARRKIV